MKGSHNGKNKIKTPWGCSRKGQGKKNRSNDRRLLDKKVIKEELEDLPDEGFDDKEIIYFGD